ncbi:MULTISPECIES: RagB/SusD family nutrient uptake outer membrane protein [unclassified Polaribacter]|uniref:RagB/SusD family nutrient uptake outer membrane protein n=1 Tax=unclassified Polaribacter TaxID=196858 RepID=UPI0011BF1CB0|nr:MULTISPECIES: RagB/SusD family nutrient uptake outer membrane protein [unclassified Polaribacter]TXD50964.1 RagB/SusD family nutrient uptake outer membrane protein [Polaribacter sp. IC063]TXD57781.1 RagB/SusD family nutrient uptake outer membrane protein [Polaribacter sp. IC066]
MKKIFLITILLSTVFSCDVLDVEPENSIAASEAFKTKNDIDKGILGAYASFQSLSYYGRTFYLFADLAADNLSHPLAATATVYAEVNNNNILPENGSVSGIWSLAYDGINVANNIIQKVPTISGMTTEEQNKALAELYFIRALNHFNLLNYFGGVPIKVLPTVGVDNLDAPRNTVDEVFAQIITDLTFAADNLTTSSNKTRASQYAAKALLARVYLYQKDYPKAIEMASEVINNGNYALLNNYRDIFDDETSESIFEIFFSQLERNRIAEYNFPRSLNGRREVEPSTDLLASYQSGDARFNASLAFDGTSAYSIKYDDLSIGADNVIVLRLADMYLIRAEAAANLPSPNVQAVRDDINLIRNRANLAATSETSVSRLLLIIENERRFEFAFEGHRWFDLVRTNRAISVLPNVKNANQMLFPIPLDEIQTNNDPAMVQNPGY